MNEDTHDIPRIIGVCSGCGHNFDLTVHGLDCPSCAHRGVSCATTQYAIDIETRGIPHVLNHAASACHVDCSACEVKRDAQRRQDQIAVLEELWRIPDERTRL